MSQSPYSLLRALSRKKKNNQDFLKQVFERAQNQKTQALIPKVKQSQVQAYFREIFKMRWNLNFEVQPKSKNKKGSKRVSKLKAKRNEKQSQGILQEIRFEPSNINSNIINVELSDTDHSAGCFSFNNMVLESSFDQVFNPKPRSQKWSSETDTE
jgi:ABC-type Zn2+ transport system substrate-binding protein/surface adhesin